MRFILSFALLLVLAAPALAATEGGHDNTMLFRVINFALLAVGLGYLIKKNAGPFFAARNESISREIAEARKVLEQSEERARAINDRLARLDRDIAELRSSSKTEMAAEFARLEREAEQSVRKILAHADQEMVEAAKAARLELKSYAASLAVSLAEKKIAGRVTPPIQQSLVGAFIRDLKGPAA